MPYRRASQWALLTVVVALLFAGCASGSTETSVDQATTTTAVDPSASALAATAAFAPADGFATLDGGTIDLAGLEGQDIVLWFWAPW